MPLTVIERSVSITMTAQGGAPAKSAVTVDTVKLAKLWYSNDNVGACGRRTRQLDEVAARADRSAAFRLGSGAGLKIYRVRLSDYSARQNQVGLE